MNKFKIEDLTKFNHKLYGQYLEKDFYKCKDPWNHKNTTHYISINIIYIISPNKIQTSSFIVNKCSLKGHAMFKIATTAVAILIFLAFSSASTLAGEAKTVKVLENIYTMIGGEGLDSNTTIITTEEGVIIIDTRPTPTEARKVLEEVRKLSDLPIV